jgi:hypothetical protein
MALNQGTIFSRAVKAYGYVSEHDFKSAVKAYGFVSGHDFSRAVKAQTDLGFRACVRTMIYKF